MAYTKITDINNGDTGASIRPKLNQVFTDLNDINTPTVQRTEDNINVLPTATDSGDNALLVSSGVSDNTKWYKRTFATLWNYIKGKINVTNSNATITENATTIANIAGTNITAKIPYKVNSILYTVMTNMGITAGSTIKVGELFIKIRNTYPGQSIIRIGWSNAHRITVTDGNTSVDIYGGLFIVGSGSASAWDRSHLLYISVSGIVYSMEVYGESTAWNANTNGTIRRLANVTDIPTSLPASDVSSWAKASTKPTYTLDEVTDGSSRKLSNYLPLSGGTVTGDLTVNGTIKKNDGTAKQTLLADGSLGYHQRIFYGTCASTGATQNKVVVCPEITSLQTSDIVIVNFSYGNTHATPRLNVNSLGAKGISVNKTKFNNANISSLINVASIYMFIYNGSTFELLNANGIYDTVVSGSGDFVTDVSLSGSMGISVKKDIGIKDIERVPNIHDALTVQLGSTYNDNVIDTFFDSHYWYFSNSEAFLAQVGNYDTFIIEPFAQGGNLDFSLLTHLLDENKVLPAKKRFHIYLKYTLKGVKLKGCVCNTTIYHDGSTYPYQIPGECSAKIECYFDEKSQVWFVEASALSFLSGEYMSEREFRASTNIDNMPMK